MAFRSSLKVPVALQLGALSLPQAGEQGKSSEKAERKGPGIHYQSTVTHSAEKKRGATDTLILF